MEKSSLDFLMKLLSAPSPSGNETAFQQIWLDNVKRFAQVETDHTGNVVGILNPEAPFKVLLAGHSDEIAMIVNRIDDNGFIYFESSGGINPKLLPGMKVDVFGYKGRLRGVIGYPRKSADASSKPACEDFFIDCGIDSGEKVRRKVRVGDYVLYHSEPEVMGENKIVCKGLDNKTGSFMVAEILKRLSKRKLKVGVYGASTTGEETNMRGAYSVGSRIRPSVAVAIDVTFNTDTPTEGSDPRASVKLGKGPALSIGSPVNVRVNQLIEKMASAKKIPLQLELTPSRTSTDADRIMFTGEGVPVTLLSLPVRYMHSPIEMASLKDMDAIVTLLTEFIAGLTGKESFCPLKI